MPPILEQEKLRFLEPPFHQRHMDEDHRFRQLRLRSPNRVRTTHCNRKLIKRNAKTICSETEPRKRPTNRMKKNNNFTNYPPQSIAFYGSEFSANFATIALDGFYWHFLSFLRRVNEFLLSPIPRVVAIRIGFWGLADDQRQQISRLAWIVYSAWWTRESLRSRSNKVNL